MGQRHQAFIVAKVKPHGGGRARYRCIGALHHQWCYGSLPVKGIVRMTTMLKQKPNAQIVLEELRSIEGKYGSHLDEEPEIPQVPCPYTLFLLNLAFNADLGSSSVSGQYISSGSHHGVLHASMGCWDGDNNDGITVVDVTDPYEPKCCLLAGCETNTDDRGLLTPEMYLRAYYNMDAQEDPEMKAYLEGVLKAVQDIKIVDRNALAEAWPSECGILAGTDELDEEDGEKTVAELVPSLTSLTLGPAIQQAIEAGDLEGGELILMQADKLPRILETLRAIEGPFPDKGLPLIVKLVENAGVVDDILAGIQLSGEQLVQVLPADAKIDVLDLTGNAALTSDGLRTLLAHTSAIRRLVLIRTGISDDDLIALLDKPATFGQVEELVHPLLYSWPRQASYPAAFAIRKCSTGGLIVPGGGVMSLPLLSLPRITDSLRRLVDALLDPQLAFSFGMGDAVYEAALSAGTIPDGKTWSERAVWCTPAAASRVPATGGWVCALSWSSLRSMLGRSGQQQYGLILLEETGTAENKESAGVAYSPQGFLDKIQEQGFAAPSEKTAQEFLAVFKRLDVEGGTQMTMHDYMQATAKPQWY
ncbi:hypothetical protein BD626DRAFT_625185 [Schizophyllum amplum]|uniref:Uncharacterized protein n=1 Tax=Schizophyllum amplum TaxID=97359 RepID=A0A550CYN5_9AGAR|nr:hypothetical protein BD626DRAFT_625185 [Auriculariopsis ampla]